MTITASEQRTYVSATVYGSGMVTFPDGSRLSFNEADHDRSDKIRETPKDGEQIQVLIDFDGRRPKIRSWKR